MGFCMRCYRSPVAMRPVPFHGSEVGSGSACRLGPCLQEELQGGCLRGSGGLKVGRANVGRRLDQGP
eukprot:1365228-Pyramimonas_sp.AAC.1